MGLRPDSSGEEGDPGWPGGSLNHRVTRLPHDAHSTISSRPWARSTIHDRKRRFPHCSQAIIPNPHIAEFTPMAAQLAGIVPKMRLNRGRTRELGRAVWPIGLWQSLLYPRSTHSIILFVID